MQRWQRRCRDNLTFRNFFMFILTCISNSIFCWIFLLSTFTNFSLVRFKSKMCCLSKIEWCASKFFSNHSRPFKIWVFAQKRGNRIAERVLFRIDVTNSFNFDWFDFLLKIQWMLQEKEMKQLKYNKLSTGQCSRKLKEKWSEKF